MVLEHIHMPFILIPCGQSRRRQLVYINVIKRKDVFLVCIVITQKLNRFQKFFYH